MAFLKSNQESSMEYLSPANSDSFTATNVERLFNTKPPIVFTKSAADALKAYGDQYRTFQWQSAVFTLTACVTVIVLATVSYKFYQSTREIAKHPGCIELTQMSVAERIQRHLAGTLSPQALEYIQKYNHWLNTFRVCYLPVMGLSAGSASLHHYVWRSHLSLLRSMALRNYSGAKGELECIYQLIRQNSIIELKFPKDETRQNIRDQLYKSGFSRSDAQMLAKTALPEG
jgi:hypothetical protein